MQRRWMAIFALLIVAIVVVGCGRVNLEDLTPEAVRTQLALTPSPTRPTPTPNASGTPGATAPAGSGHGDRAAGRSLYNTWCTGCHESGRLDAPVILGQSFDVAEWIPILRSPGNRDRHPVSYTLTELSDDNFDDVFAYIAQP